MAKKRNKRKGYRIETKPVVGKAKKIFPKGKPIW